MFVIEKAVPVPRYTTTGRTVSHIEILKKSAVKLVGREIRREKTDKSDPSVRPKDFASKKFMEHHGNIYYYYIRFE